MFRAFPAGLDAGLHAAELLAIAGAFLADFRAFPAEMHMMR